MPNYEYKCKDCGSTFTMLQSILAKRTGAKCPDCGGENTERLISRFGSSSDGGSCSTGWPFS